MRFQNTKDTIAARCTTPGEGGIAVIRISGPDSLAAAQKCFQKTDGSGLENRRFTYGHILDGNEVIDEAMAVYMKAPNTYTREDVVELQCHGSDYLVKRILSILSRLGVRAAEPGEFTYRAFIGGRIDLTQAEAVMQMIRADSQRAVQSASRALSGGTSGFVSAAMEKITGLLASLAAAIDFPDEVEETETAERVRERCGELRKEILSACDVRQGRIDSEGIQIVFAGLPNAGKSSLFNALIRGDRAIVTDIPGTTRDTLSESILYRGVRMVFTDTAGLRDSSDVVERIGVERALKAASQADVSVLIIDASIPFDREQAGAMPELPDLIVLSKQDLKAVADEKEIRKAYPDRPIISVCAPKNEGIDQLLDFFLSKAGSVNEGACLTQLRHIEAAEKACQSLLSAIDSIDHGMPLDLCAIDLSSALEHLGSITGEYVTEQVIDRIFADFCVGK